MRTVEAIEQPVRDPSPTALRRVVDEGDFRMVFQPVFSLSDRSGEPVGFEALSRFEGGAGPETWFEAAADEGLRVRLETAAAAKAVAEADRLPEGAFVAVNASVAALQSLPFLEALLAGPLERMVIEVTEAELDHPALDEVVVALRMLGVRLAVDDLGTGPVSLARLAELAPELIKLDGSVVGRLAGDPTARAMVAALVALAEELGSQVVAERIEEDDTVDSLRELGVRLGQGFALGRPAPA